MANAKDYKPKDSGILCGVVGMPATGKSTLILSAGEVGKLAVALSPKSELDRYAGNDLEYEVFWDDLWQPWAGKYQAGAFQRFLKWLAAQAERPATEVRTVGIDTGGAFSDLAMHEVMQQHGNDDPMSLEHGRAFYPHNQLMKQMIAVCALLSARGKNVIVAWHGSMREQEGIGDVKEIVANRQTGVKELRYEDKVMPVMHGSLRQSIAKDFSLWLHTKIDGFGAGLRYLVQAVPSKDALSRSRLPFKEGVNTAKLPNNFKAVLEVLR